MNNLTLYSLFQFILHPVDKPILFKDQTGFVIAMDFLLF